MIYVVEFCFKMLKGKDIITGDDSSLQSLLIFQLFFLVVPWVIMHHVCSRNIILYDLDITLLVCFVFLLLKPN